MANGQVTVLLNSGIDAFTNLYDVHLSFPGAIPVLRYPAPTDLAGYSYSVRAMGFNPPELSAQTYQSDYKTIQLTRQAAKIIGDRTFNIEFRLDSGFLLYEDLMQWKHLWVDPSGEGNMQPGSLSDDIGTNTPVIGDNRYGQVTVVAYSVSTPLDGYSDPSTVDSSAYVAAEWVFSDVVCNKVGVPNFQRAGSDSVTVTAEFLFGRYIEPFSPVNPISSPISPIQVPPPLTGESSS